MMCRCGRGSAGSLEMPRLEHASYGVGRDATNRVFVIAEIRQQPSPQSFLEWEQIVEHMCRGTFHGIIAFMPNHYP